MSGAIAPDTEDTMITHWHWYHALIGKSADGEYHVLQYTWRAFIRRWSDCNWRGESFLEWLYHEDDKRLHRSLGALHEYVCTLACEAERMCFIDVNEGCRVCGVRQTRAE